MKAAFYRGTRPGLQGIYSRAVRWLEPWRNGPNGAAALVLTMYQQQTTTMGGFVHAIA